MYWSRSILNLPEIDFLIPQHIGDRADTKHIVINTKMEMLDFERSTNHFISPKPVKINIEDNNNRGISPILF